MYLENIVKEYKDFTKVVQYKKPFLIIPPTCKFHNKISCGSCFKRSTQPKVTEESLRKTKAKFQDYVLNNDFSLFMTFTFDKQKVDRYSDETVKDSMQKWLKEAKRVTSPDLAYIIVAERHKDGAIHYHALFHNFNGQLKYWFTDRKKNSNKKVYKIPSWPYGIATAKICDNQLLRMSRYMTKNYLTKDMVLIGNKKRYWASRNLKLPTKRINQDLYDNIVMTESTGIKHKTTDNLELYTIQRKPGYIPPKEKHNPYSLRLENEDQHAKIDNTSPLPKNHSDLTYQLNLPPAVQK